MEVEDNTWVTTAQEALLNEISDRWVSLAEPSVVLLSAGIGRGKSRVIQALYDRLVAAEPQGRRFWTGRLAGNELGDWRRSRKNVRPPAVDVTQQPDWLWFGMGAYPAGRVDLMEEVQSLNARIVDGYRRGLLPFDRADQLARGLVSVPSDVIRSVVDLAADFLPGGSAVKATGELFFNLGRAASRQGELALPLHVSNPREVARALAVTSFGAAVLGGSKSGLVPVVLALDDAQLLPPSAIEILDHLIEVNPEEELLGSGLLRGRQRNLAAAHGMPSRLPLLIIASTSGGGSDSLTAASERWASDGISTVTFGEEHFRAWTREEALAVIEGRLMAVPLTLEQRILISDFSIDRVLGGVYPPLLLAHCERVAGLFDPATTLTKEWGEEHLPRLFEDDAKRRFEELPAEARAVAVSGSLRGVAFAYASVRAMLPDVADSTFEVLHRSGYADHFEANGYEQLTFSDEASFGFAFARAIQDPPLCYQALAAVADPLVNDLLGHATVGPFGGGTQIYDITRLEAFRYRDLVDKAGLDPSRLDPEVWAAARGFGSEQEVLRAMFESGPMNQLWAEMANSSTPLDGQGWAIGARWVIHKHLPGPLTFGNAFQAGEAASGWTRFASSAPARAARIASRVVPYLSSPTRSLMEPGLRLLLRLGMAGQLLIATQRRSVALALLEVASYRLSAAVLLARVFARDLPVSARRDLLDILRSGPAPDPHTSNSLAECRRALGLAWLAEPLEPEEADQVIETLLSASRAAHSVMEPNFPTLGRFTDVADPATFPWMSTDAQAGACLLTHKRFSTREGLASATVETLMPKLQYHPGVAWALSRKPEHLTASMSADVNRALEVWRRAGALEAGRFDLLGPTGPPRRRR